MPLDEAYFERHCDELQIAIEEALAKALANSPEDPLEALATHLRLQADERQGRRKRTSKNHVVNPEEANRGNS